MSGSALDIGAYKILLMYVPEVAVVHTIKLCVNVIVFRVYREQSISCGYLPV